MMTGNALQDDMVATVQRFVSRGRDILGMGLGGSATNNDQNTPILCPKRASKLDAHKATVVRWLER